VGSFGAIRNRLVDSPTSFAERFRRGRWEMLLEQFPDIADMRVLDLGGRAESWRRAPVTPVEVCVVNLEPLSGNPPDGVEEVQGNACELPPAVTERSFDLVFSNAVLEHVGGHANRVAFAASVNRMAPRHWVQTPYRYFPVEPHWIFPLFQHLPVAVRVQVSQRWQLMHSPSANRADALDAVLNVELVSLTEMRYYFPQSTILRERIGPLIKSVIAVKG
jgi:Methyltransferase domain